MLISKNWLRDFVFLPDAFDAVDLANRLSLATVEVEKVINQGEALRDIVVGEIKTIAAHPNADKLKVCTVDVGNEELPIVCGGSNIKEGMKVAVAKLGASVRWHGQDEPIIMERAMIRGQESLGMICASDEIGLADRFPKQEEKEIVDLSSLNVKVGTPLAIALGMDDVIFDIDNKSMTNRPDLWGHYGMAREIAALTRKNFKALKFENIKTNDAIKISVNVKSPELCPRYIAVAVSGVSATKSPEWMTQRLEVAGMRSINAIVDLTNYVMLELGQPLHAFDADVLNQTSDNKKQVTINIRNAMDKEKFITLDDKECTLTSDMLVIADGERALAIAGIKGGKNSGVSETTNTVVFEAATFDASNIRRTSSALGLRTDSSARFEKSLDPQLAELALQRVVELAHKIFPKSKVVSNVVDQKNKNQKLGLVLTFPWSFINERLGIEVDQKNALDILERLGFGVQIKKGIATVNVPSWRSTKDVTAPEDIVEEVARLYGYENIPGTLPTFSITPPEVNQLRTLEREIKEVLAFEAALTEVYNYSFASPEWLQRLGFSAENYLALDNPIAKDRPWLRRDLFPGLVENVENNAHRFESVRLFEIGRVYRGEESGERAKPNGNELLPQQPTMLGVAISEKNNEQPFFTVSHALNLIAARIGVPLKIESTTISAPQFHPGRSAKITCGGEVVGTIAELHPRIQQSLGIAHRVALAELSLSTLVNLPRASEQFTATSDFPSVDRDIAFVVPQKYTHEEISAALRLVDQLIVNVELFDVYVGEHVPEGMKSLAYHITYQASDRTLTTENIDAAHKEIEKQLKKQFKADFRK